MSPARSHVEQSRNTLLFASCAKEVTTNAQVNVAMSDKALVKHLQRELARLESELRYPRACIFPSDYEALLQEKDLQIQQVMHFDDDKKYLQNLEPLSFVTSDCFTWKLWLVSFLHQRK